jgi:nucleoside-diphosphate-sugar epimerase
VFNLKKILVTGGSGFIGTNLIRKLLQENHKVINIDLVDSQLGVETKKIDLTKTDFSFLDSIEFDYVIHLAALSNPRFCADPKNAFDTNVIATFNLLNNLTQKKIRKIIFMSSIVVYSDDVTVPIKEDSTLDIHHNNYSFTKGICESICEQFRKKEKLPIITFRLSNIYGPFQSIEKFPNLVPQLMLNVIKSGKLEVWNKDPIRDWVYAEDAVDAIISGLDSEYNGTINLGTGVGTSVGDVAELLSGLSGLKLESLNKEASPPLKIICDISKIKSELNWEPKTSLEEGIKKTYEHYKEILD